jgi:uncharacterized protein (DUF486 family)
MPILSWPVIGPWLLLVASNLFMTTAWYWHLKFKAWPIVPVILISWLIAGVEYAIAVPANRMGSAVYSAAQLKTIQEVITLATFAGFSVLYLGEPLRWSTVGGFMLILAGAALVFAGRG